MKKCKIYPFEGWEPVRSKHEVFLPLEEGKTYKTKFATGEHFTITKIKRFKVKIKGEEVERLQIMGIYEKNPDLGECPINEDRLIPEKIIE